MKTAIMDLFTAKADAICITTNGITKNNGDAVMGKGIAKTANDLYSIAHALGKQLRLNGNHVYDMGIHNNKHILTFPTKQHWRDDSSIDLIKQSCVELVALADKMQFNTVLLPAVGCGCGRLDFNKDVYPVISELLDDRFIVCFIQ